MLLNKTSNSNLAQWIYFIGALIISPVFFLGSTLDHQLIPRFLMISFFLGIISIIILKKIKSYTFPTHSPVLWLLLFFYLFNVLSILWSVNFAEGVLESQRVFIGLCIFFYTLFFSTNSKNFEQTAVKAVTIVSLIIIFVGITQLYKLNKFDSDSLYSVTSINGHKNLMSSILFLCLPFLLNGFSLLGKIWKWLIGVSIFFIFTFIFILQTRAVWMGLFTSFILLGAVISIKSKFIYFLRKFLLYLVAIIILVGIISLLYFKIEGKLDPYMERFNITKYQSSESGIERLQIWEKTWCVFKSHMFVGVGAGNWQILFPSCNIWHIWRLEQFNFTFQRPHNDFLWVLCELGIIGTFPLFLIFCIFLISMISSAVKNKNLKELKNVSIYSAAFIGFLVVSFFDFPKERIEHVIFSSTLLGLIFHKLNDKINWANNIKIKIKPHFIILMIILLSSFNLLVATERIKGEYYCKKMYVYKGNKNWKKTIENADKAYSHFFSVDPTSVPVHWYRGVADFQLQQYQQALIDFQKANTFHPYNFHVLNNLGSTYSMLGNDVEAEKLYLEALKISPDFDDPKLNLAAIYYKQGKYEDALHYVRTTYNDSPRKRKFLEVIQNKIH